jgi:hypothetical protein
MLNQRSTIIVVIVIVAAVALVALAFSQQQQTANRANDAATAQAIAESNETTAIYDAEVAATAQAVAESGEATAVFDAEVAATAQAVAESGEATAVYNAEMAAATQAVAESNAATAIYEAEIAFATKIAAISKVEAIRATATQSAESMATAYSQLEMERATVVANYEALAAASTQTSLDLTPTPSASSGDLRLTNSIDMSDSAAGFSATIMYPESWSARLRDNMVAVASDEALLSGVEAMPENAGLVTIAFITPELAAAWRLAEDADAADVISLFIGGSEGVAETSGPTEITVNGVRMVRGIIKDQDGDGELLAYQVNDIFVLAICVASPGKLDNYGDTFEAIAASVNITE